MNNKGFAITGIFYGILILFLTTIILMLFNLQNKKTILDELKSDSVSAVECNDNMDYVLGRLSQLEGNVENVSSKIDNIYPIGSIYTSVDSKNPSELFGGTWVKFGVGKTILGTDTESEKSGGSSSVKLTASNIPTLTSTGTTTAKSATTNSTGSGYSIGYGSSTRTTASTGSGYTLKYGSSTRTTSSNGSHSHTSTHLGSTSGGSVGYYGNTGTYSSLQTGSAGAHTHTVSDSYVSSISGVGAHTHKVSDYYANSISGIQAHTHTLTIPALTATTTYTNSDQKNIDVQNPYITVYMWKRTA